MKRKSLLITVSFLLLVSLFSVSILAGDFNQAPVLQEMENEGLIPALADRLPVEPMVVEPLHQVGEYGGTAHLYNALSSNTPFDAIFLMGRYGPFRTDKLGNPGVPNLFKGYDVNDDFTEWTFHLREGVKWSDGHPLTAWNWYDMWKYYHGNSEISAHIPDENVTVEDNAVTFYDEHGQGRTVKKEVIDDHTIRYTSDKPYPTKINRMTNIFSSDAQPVPMHFLKQFHPEIIGEEEADEKAEKAGFDTWIQLFENFSPMAQGHMTTNQVTGNWPTLSPYVLVEKTQSRLIFERNPYFFQVDTEGNQLPYIDRIVVEQVADTEIINGRIITGDTDFQAMTLSPENIPLFRKFEEQGNYKSYVWDNAVNVAVFEPHYSYEDEVVRDLFRDREFRIALQISIDKEAINDEILFGMSNPGRVTVLPDTKWYKEEYETKYAEFDPERAKEILDDMGVVDQNGDGWRQDPDGNDIHWVVEHVEGETPYGPVAEMVIDDWQSIGLNVTRRQIDQSVANPRIENGELAMWIWHGDGRDGLVFPTFITRALSPGHLGNSWMTYYNTDGELGEEPPAEVVELYDLHTEMTFATSDEEQIRLGRDYLENVRDNVWTIGTVNGVPHPLVVTNDMRNFPTEEDFPGEGAPTYLHALFWTNPYNPPQFFFEGRDELSYKDSKLPIMYRELDMDPIERALEHDWL